MSRFTEFLQTRAQEEKAKAEASKPLIEEWKKAVTELILQMDAWLREADPGHVLKVESMTIEKREERLGFYQVRGLVIRHLGREVKVVPMGRMSGSDSATFVPLPYSRPEGRVDVTDGLTRYALVRMTSGTERRWVVFEDRHPIRTLDKQVFEDMMMDLLQ